MRCVLFFLVAAILATACVIDIPGQASRDLAARDAAWRRTELGWERVASAPRAIEPTPLDALGAVHPVTVAALQVWLCGAAMAASAILGERKKS
jgi:hypothetical protein